MMFSGVHLLPRLILIEGARHLGNPRIQLPKRVQKRESRLIRLQSLSKLPTGKCTLERLYHTHTDKIQSRCSPPGSTGSLSAMMQREKGPKGKVSAQSTSTSKPKAAAPVPPRRQIPGMPPPPPVAASSSKKTS